MFNYNNIEKILFLSIHLNEKELHNKLEGKTVLITGASSGIGKELAFVLKNTKAHLVLVARREEIKVTPAEIIKSSVRPHK